MAAHPQDPVYVGGYPRGRRRSGPASFEAMPVHIHPRREWRAAALALVPMALALGGMYLDERAQFGYSNWRGACRATGFDIAALITFTIDLMPRAALGALLGMMLVQGFGAVIWRGGGAPRAIFAAHTGCGLGMAGMLLVCAWLPMPVMVGVEAVLAAVAAALCCGGGMRTKAYSGRWNRGRKFSASITSQVSA